MMLMNDAKVFWKLDVWEDDARRRRRSETKPRILVFFLNWPSPASFMFIFSLFETDNMNFYNKNVSLVLVLGFELITY